VFRRNGKALRTAVSILLVLLMAYATGCASQESTAPTTSDSQTATESTTADFTGQELNLYVAAGLKKPMDTVIDEFQEATGAEVLANYGSSGELYAQIQAGQPCDLYYSADWIYIEKCTDIDMVVEEQKFLKDHLVLAVSSTGATKITSLEDVTKDGVTLVVADAQAPIGKYSEAALKSLGLWDKIGDTLKARPSTVNQVAIMVKEDQVDAGLVYSSTANANELKTVADIAEKDSGEVIFGAAMLKSDNQELAKAFMEFVTAHADEFEKYGFETYN